MYIPELIPEHRFADAFFASEFQIQLNTGLIQYKYHR
jgi:hypothetical protein